MGTESDRIQRYLEDDLERCRVEDVETRLTELELLEAATGSGRVESDLAILSTLGNETRYRLVRVLAAADGELCVCELRGLVDASESTISHALSDLADAGLVRRRKDGRWRKYRATNAAVAIVSMMDGVGTGD